MAATFDYIIIGAGSAGCVLANRLSADETVRVLLLEAGGTDDDPHVLNPNHGYKDGVRNDHDWGFKTVPQPYAHNREMDQPRGKLLGGSSSVNSMLYVRGHAEDYDRWASYGNTGWSYADVLPYFKKSENFEPGGNEFHGEGGGLNVTHRPDHHPYAKAVIAAVKERDYPLNPDFNGAQQDGWGFYQVTQKDGLRCSTSVGFLKPALSHANLAVETYAIVTRVIVEDGRATGVEYIQNDQTHTAHTAGEVILSAGAFKSPQILMLSGIGPADHLREFNIPVITDLPGVGENLQDHPDAVLYFRANDDHQTPDENPEWYTGGFIRTQPDLTSPDVQFHVLSCYTRDGKTGFIIAPCVLRPHSTGTVRLCGDSPFDAPLIDQNYLAEQYDIDRLVDGINFALDLAETDALKAIRDTDFDPLYGKDPATYVRDVVATAYHPACTCKMGPADDPLAVVDNRLRVHGIDGLRVIDASIMPDIIAGNTNAPSIMIGERGAALVLEDRA